mmetsp:Transcript_15845/g.47261  ORF Transcript_15845/g.47261 Transcript_15845/m.47261 type:complete len:97 (+) Transcript_15845:92-382(+)
MKGRQLLRAILREHKKRLPQEMRELGDRYVVKEFSDARAITEDRTIKEFETQWRGYLEHLRTQRERFGAELSGEAVEGMTDEQRRNLLALRESTLK